MSIGALVSHIFTCQKIFSFSYADDVLIGDELMINEVGELIPEKVINVTEMEMQGDH